MRPIHFQRIVYDKNDDLVCFELLGPEDRGSDPETRAVLLVESSGGQAGISLSRHDVEHLAALLRSFL